MLNDKERFTAFLENESPRRGDVIVLLEGDGHNRVQHAARLYADNYAPKIIILGGDKRRAYGSYPSSELRRELMKQGVPKSAMYVEERAANTLGEARRAMTLAKKYHWKSMILVTSPHHQFRAFLTFLKVMRGAKLDILLVNAPAHLPWFGDNPWGKRSLLLEGEFERINEYQKKGHCASYAEGLQYLADAERHLYGQGEDDLASVSARPTILPYSIQDINEADVRAISAVLRSSYLTQGPAVEKFERSLAQYTGTRYAVAFSSGTAALHAAYFAAGIGAGDEIITSALTFAATSNAALYLGARPVFADIDLNSGTMSVVDTAKKITKKTKALVPVDYGGRPADMRGFRALAKKHKLVLIENGAQSLGASYRGKKIGRFADMTMFSFHPVKSITTGEGGVIVTDNLEYASNMRLFRHHGISKDASTFKDTGHAAWYQEMQTLGYNYRLSDIQAGLGISQMSRLDANVEKRRLIAERYRNLLGDIPGIILPPKEMSHEKSAWHLYPMRLGGKFASKRDEVFSALRAKGIGVQVHYLPVYLHQYYRTLGYKPGTCPNAEAYAVSEISLPLYPQLSVRDQDYVAEIVREIITGI